MVEIKRDCAVYGAQRERLVFDLMKKFPIGPGNMSVILTMEEAAATITVMDEEIARLTAERDEARAEAKAAYSRAAALAQAKHEVALKWASVHIPGFDGNTDSLLIANEIRALATEPGTTALAEMLDAETRACAEVVRERRQGWLRPYIIARIDQRKEAM